jgi:predicted aldo/keto reductase-like oxidoreductase
MPIPTPSLKLGFGLMRLPRIGGGSDMDAPIDVPQTARMADAFLAAGGTYFDTAFVYEGSEEAARDALVSRHPRTSFTLASKLNAAPFAARTEAEAKSQLRTSLDRSGAGYFDYYLLHALSASNREIYENYGLWDYVRHLRDDGLVRHIGFSFHDSADVLRRILDDHPEAEFVQLQINYADWDDSGVQSRLCYEAAAERNLPIIVMEPVKGGGLVKLPEEAQKIFDDLNARTGHTYSNAAYALRFAGSFPQIAMVLSGMGSKEQMLDNLSAMQPVQPLDEAEKEAIQQVTEVFRGLHLIPCTACHYCTDGCPMQIQIPDLFAVLNAKNVFHDGIANYYYENSLTVGGHGKASDCIECGHCEGICPQHLPVIELLKQVSEVFDKKA